MKCPYCNAKAEKIHKDLFSCGECGEFTQDDVEVEKGQKKKSKRHYDEND